MSLRAQIRKDLHNHADARLHTWVTDTFEIYQLADLDARDAAADTIFCMMTGICALAVSLRTDPEVVADYFTRMIRIAARNHEESQQ
jgi:hypothetical protein